MRYSIIIMAMALGSMASAESVQDWVNSIHGKHNSNELSQQEKLDLQTWLNNVKNRPNFNKADLKRPLTDGKKLDLDAIIARYGKLQADQGATDTSTFMALVSLSMPDAALVQIMGDVYDAGGVVMIRGLYKNSIRETTFRMQQIIQKSGVGDVSIDPRVFRLFKVKTVPTFIVTKTPIDKCLDRNCNKIPMHDKWVGHVSIDTVLEHFTLRGDTAKRAKSHLYKLRRAKS